MLRQQDVVAGFGIIALAAFILHALSKMPKASYQAIPPDLFPKICACALILGGVVLIVRGILRGSPDFVVPAPRALFTILAAVISFGLLAPRIGYAPAGLVTLVVSGLGTPELRRGELLLFSLGMIAVSVVLFSLLLKLSMPILVLPGLRI